MRHCKKKTEALAVLALAAFLAGCAGNQAGTDLPSGQSGTETEETVMAGNEKGGQAAEEGSIGNQDDVDENGVQAAGTGAGSQESEIGEDAGGLQDNGRTGTGDTDTAVREYFVDKLTEEGKGWGLVFGESGTQPTGNASVEELAQYDAYFMGSSDENVIYLTFDCGYENGNTEPILDALKAHNAPATFFVVGHFLETAPELVKRMADEGHAVGNHTWHHYDINGLDRETFQAELEDVASRFQEITGTELSPCYRPPEGKCGITNLKMAQELGYSAIFWSLAYVDWDVENQPDHQAALDKLTDRIHPGAVVLLHNTSKTNGEILDELLTKWEEMGYSFSPLSDLIGTAASGN